MDTAATCLFVQSKDECKFKLPTYGHGARPERRCDGPSRADRPSPVNTCTAQSDAGRGPHCAGGGRPFMGGTPATDTSRAGDPDSNVMPPR